MMCIDSPVKIAEEILTKLAKDIPAKTVVLVDAPGNIVTAVTDIHHTDLIALGALIAAEAATSYELNSITHKNPINSYMAHIGKTHNNIIQTTKTGQILFVQFSSHIPLTTAHKHIQQTVATLQTLEWTPHLTGKIFTDDFLLHEEIEQGFDAICKE